MFVHRYKKKQIKNIVILLGTLLVSVVFYNLMLIQGLQDTIKSQTNQTVSVNISLSKEINIDSVKINNKPIKAVKISKYKNEKHLARVDAVKRFLARHHAPLYNNAEDFVSAAEKYNIDYRLAPSISIVESGGGKNLFRRYNPFGWGKKNYSSFKSAIYDVSRGLSNYYKGGARTPRAISWRYNPDTPNEWSRKVTYLVSTMPRI